MARDSESSSGSGGGGGNSSDTGLMSEAVKPANATTASSSSTTSGIDTKTEDDASSVSFTRPVRRTVRTSFSSSSGLELSPSSSNEEELKKVEAKIQEDNDEPTYKDVLDVIKFSFILQETDLHSGDLPSVPRVTHELWSDLKESLTTNTVLYNCSHKKQSHEDNECGCCGSDNSNNNNNKRPCVSNVRGTVRDILAGKNVSFVTNKKESASRCCPVGGALRDSLGDVVREGLLSSLMPFLLPTKNSAVSNAPNSSAGVTPSSTIVGSAAESSGKEEDGDLSRVPSCASLSNLTAGSRLQQPRSANALIRRTTSAASALNRLKQVGGPNVGGVSQHLLQTEEEDLASMRNRDVTIHVCDETRDAKKDFTCRQDLLLSQMGYFRDITSGQSLEDVDISVHCDVTIFEWLMAWLKQQGIDEEDERPKLEPSNVVSILVSASFLKMGPLVELALKYVHQNMNRVLVTTHNLNCLGEPLLTRLAILYRPTEVEELMDRRDRIHSRLYTKLIVSLCEPMPQPGRELFQTAATLHRCRLCGMFLTQQSAKILPCHPLRSTVNRRGEVVPKHQRDPNFNLNDFLRSLRIELKSWRKVFWRLWGLCHALYCSLCSTYFPVYLHEFCSFHPQDPEFPNIQFKNSTQPFGTFICCQTSVYRFQPLQMNQKGCQSRDHRVKIRNDHDSQIFRVLMAHRDLICLCPTRKSGIKITSDANSITLPAPLYKDHDLWSVADDFTTELCLTPQRKRRGLVNRTLWETLRTSVIQGVLKKSGHSLFSAVQAARASQQQSHSEQSSDQLSTTTVTISTMTKSASTSNIAASRMVYGRLKRAPKLPVKPALQSSESSSATDEMSGSEESSSSCLDDADNDNANLGGGLNNDNNASSVTILGGGGTEEDEPGFDPLEGPHHIGTTSMSASNSKADLCIEIKLGKDRDLRSKTLLSASGLHVNGGGANTRASSASGTSVSGRGAHNDPVSAWMRWDGDRTIRANQDYQREREEMAMRDLLRHLSRRQQHLARQQQQYHSGGRPATAAPSSVTSAPFGGAFMRLEQDWRETHMSYLQHRSASAAALAPPSSLTASRGGLTRPNSAASLRSARHSRITRHS